MSDAFVYVVVGALVILGVWGPLFVRLAPVSLAMVAVALGGVLTLFVDTDLNLFGRSAWPEREAEFALLVAVLGAGLKIDRPFSVRGWATTWRLLFIVMLLSIAAIALAGWWILGLPAGLAILLAAALAPTDPVLAASVQVGPPGEGDESETKFGLTSEAGLNDGMAFPFVVLGLAIIAGDLNSAADYLRWLSVDLVWDVGGGAAVGAGLGWTLVALSRRLPEGLRLSATDSGLASVGLAFLAYGLAKEAHCNGFVAVFCEAMMFRNLVRSFDYSRRLNHAAEQFERVAMVMILALLGEAIMKGLLADIGLREVVFALVVLLLIRPAAVLSGFLGSAVDVRGRAALGYFGMRGIGSLYYVIYALLHSPAGTVQRLPAVVGLVVLASILLYGVTTGVVTRLLLNRPGD